MRTATNERPINGMSLQSDSRATAIHFKNFPINLTSLWKVQLKTLDGEYFFDIRTWGIEETGKEYPRKKGLFIRTKPLINDLIPYVLELKGALPSL